MYKKLLLSLLCLTWLVPVFAGNTINLSDELPKLRQSKDFASFFKNPTITGTADQIAEFFEILEKNQQNYDLAVNNAKDSKGLIRIKINAKDECVNETQLQAIKDILSTEQASKIQYLDISNLSLGRAKVNVLEDKQRLSNLATLILANNSITEKNQLNNLLHTQDNELPNLTTLDLWGNLFGDNGVQALSQMPIAKQLTNLMISGPVYLGTEITKVQHKEITQSSFNILGQFLSLENLTMLYPNISGSDSISQIESQVPHSLQTISLYGAYTREPNSTETQQEDHKELEAKIIEAVKKRAVISS